MENIYNEATIKNNQVETIKDMLISRASMYEDYPVFLQKNEKGGLYYEISYKQLLDDVTALGARLIDMGLKDEKIAIVGVNCYQWMVAYLAIVCGVGIAVPFDKELSAVEVENLMERSGCKTIFFTEDYEKLVDNLDSESTVKIRMNQYTEATNPPDSLNWNQLMLEGRSLPQEKRDEYLDFKLDPMKLSILLYTSGTTGKAKGVMLNHHNVISNVINVAKIINLTPKDRTLSILPIHHTLECNLGIFVPLYNGSSVAFGEGLKYIAKNLIEANVTVLVGVPLIFEGMYQKIWKNAEKAGKSKMLNKGIKLNRVFKAFGVDKSRKLFKLVYDNIGPSIRMFVTGAADINPKICRGFEDLGIQVLQGYGLTECSPLVSGTPYYGNTYKKAGSVGPVINGGSIKIINKDEDGIGEILYSGPNVMMGYYNMPEETEEVIRDGWFYTGDYGFIDSENWLYITGRRKNIIVTKSGKNIYPEEIENHMKSKYIEEMLVYGIVDKNSEDVIVSAQIRPNYQEIQEEFGDSFDEEEIYALMKNTIKDANQSLPNYKWVRSITVRKEEFVKTSTKKIKRFENV